MAKAEEKDKGISVSDQFIADFVAKGGKITTDTGSLIDDENVDKLLNQVAGPDSKGTTKKQEELHKEAVKVEAADTTKDDEKAAIKEQQRIETLRKDDEKARHTRVEQGIAHGSRLFRHHLANPALERAGNVVDKVSSASTAGGVGLLVVLLMFLLMVVVQVNAAGDTRLKQLWYMLNGRAALTGRVYVQQQDAKDSGVVNAGQSIGSTVGGALGGAIGTGIAGDPQGGSSIGGAIGGALGTAAGTIGAATSDYRQYS